METSKRVLLMVLCFVTLAFDTYAEDDPDSSRMEVGVKLTDLVKTANGLCTPIVSLDDRNDVSAKWSRVEETTNKLVDAYPWIMTDETLGKLYEQYCDARDIILNNIKQFDYQHKQDSLLGVMSVWKPRFDTLLAVGQVYAQKKEADSVRMIKSRADDWWGLVNGTYSTFSDYFSSNEELSQQYRCIEDTKDSIQALSEKERVKLRDILLVGGVLVGVLAILGGILIPQIKIMKSKKEPPIEI